MILETRQTPRFGFVCVDRECLVIAPPRMRRMVHATAKRAVAPLVDDVEGEGNVHRDRRVQAGRRLPGLEPNAGDVLACFAGVRQRQAATVAGDHMPLRIETVGTDLQPLGRRIL